MGFDDDWLPPHKAAAAARKKLAKAWPDFRAVLVASLDAWGDAPFGHPLTRKAASRAVLVLLDGIMGDLTAKLGDDRLLFARITDAAREWSRPRAILAHAMFDRLNRIRIAKAQLKVSSHGSVWREELTAALRGDGLPDVLRCITAEEWEAMSQEWRGVSRGRDIGDQNPPPKSYSAFRVILDTMRRHGLTTASTPRELRELSRAPAYSRESED